MDVTEYTKLHALISLFLSSKFLFLDTRNKLIETKEHSTDELIRNLVNFSKTGTDGSKQSFQKGILQK